MLYFEIFRIEEILEESFFHIEKEEIFKEINIFDKKKPSLIPTVNYLYYDYLLSKPIYLQVGINFFFFKKKNTYNRQNLIFFLIFREEDATETISNESAMKLTKSTYFLINFIIKSSIFLYFFLINISAHTKSPIKSLFKKISKKYNKMMRKHKGFSKIHHLF